MKFFISPYFARAIYDDRYSDVVLVTSNLKHIVRSEMYHFGTYTQNTCTETDFCIPSTRVRHYENIPIRNLSKDTCITVCRKHFTKYYLNAIHLNLTWE